MTTAPTPNRVGPPMPARPGVVLLLAVALGQEWLPAALGPVPLPPGAVVLVAVAAALVVLWRGRWLFPALLAVAIAAAWHQGNSHAAARADGRRMAGEVMAGGRPMVQVDGIVVATPRRGPTAWTVMLGAGATTEWEGNRMVFPLPTAMRVPVGVAAESVMESLVPGDRLVGAGEWLALATAGEPGEPEEWLVALGAGALVRARMATPIVQPGGPRES